MSARLAAFALTALVAFGFASAQTPATQPSPPNELTPAEKAAGWQLLFDGKSTAGWRGFRAKAMPEKGWKVEDGCLRVVADERGGDILSTGQYGDFDLLVEFRVAPHANSGIFFRVTEDGDGVPDSGPEFQIIDDLGFNFPPTGGNSNGALYALAAPPENKPQRPAGEWNQARIRWRHGVLQQWLNGVKITEVRTDGDDWQQRIAKSKFKDAPAFAKSPKGHIALQDYGNDVWFRNMKIRDLDTPLPGEVRLFNGRNLDGWKAFLPDGTAPEKVWSVPPAPGDSAAAGRTGVLICRGEPAGYIRTERDFTNYVLKLEWRFEKPGNSGVLLRVIGPDKVWPRCMEAQLQHGSAGDFWNIDEFPAQVDPARTQGRNTQKTHFAERPVGEWNEYEIIVDRGRIVLYVNGEKLNEAWNVQETPGKIALQSEGSIIHFRDIRLAPIP